MKKRSMAEKIMVCNKCNKLFRVKFSGVEKVKCPKCGSDDVESIYKKG